MKSYQQKEHDSLKNVVNEDAAQFLTEKNEEERLREAIYMSDMEKFRLFTKMLRRNALYKRAIVSHKK